MNQKISELYQSNDVNPLAGCIPSFIQIPIFIGLYRAVLTLAKDNKLNEPFLFLPSLEGPTYGADPTHGNDWILQGWVDGVPSLGWDQTTAFLILPVFLVISQFISMELMQPKAGPDGTKPDSPFILKFLPLMIGWFSLNVPSALCIYWVANNIITTATTLFIRSQMENAPVAVASAPSAPASSSSFAPPPMREKPAGFSAAFEEDPDITPITPTDVIDAEIEVADSEGDAAGEGMAEVRLHFAQVLSICLTLKLNRICCSHRPVARRRETRRRRRGGRTRQPYHTCRHMERTCLGRPNITGKQRRKPSILPMLSQSNVIGTFSL